ncbi:restriction endonuclease subunit S [Paenibacillus sp. FSL R7-0204]|uniref:restriction endonuclease subunit S n=1 Tax=Paenibacillus sp. FSL R7-0204 TaxID=2921675 RepID=UPI0030FBB813
MSFSVENIEYRPLTSVLKFIVDNRGKTAPTSDTGIPLIATNCIKDNELYPVFEKVRFISEDTYNNWFRAHPIPGDIIFVNKGTPGRVCLVPDPVNFCIAQDMMAFRVDEDIVDNKYLFAVLRSSQFQNQIVNYHVGTLIPHFKKGDLDKLLIPIPSMKIQKIIGDYYFSICNRIELNNRMNKVLEQMAQAIFKQWFVDFEFPNENNEPYKSSGGEMIKSEVGMIPLGWEVSNIESLTEIIIDYRGKTPKKLGRNWSETGIIALSAKNIKNEGLVNLDQANRVDEELYNLWMKDELKYGDILLTSEAPLGELYFKANDDKYCLSQRLFAIRANSNAIIPEILYMYLRTSEVMGEIVGRATGTTVTGIRQSELRKVKVINPSSDIQARCQSLLSTVFKKKNVIEKENRKLINVRNTLLPKLMSGEIDVSNIEL